MMFCGATPKQQIEIVVHGVQGLRVPAGDSAARLQRLKAWSRIAICETK
jgi:hypothetical protein